MRTTSNTLLIILVLATNVIPPLSIDEYTPSMPYMLHVFGVDASIMQLTITFYLFAFFVSQVVGGILSDRFGRRTPLLLSMPIYLIGCAVAMFASQIHMLMLGRILQGLGVGICALTGPALMADCFKGKELTKVSSYYSTVYSFIPISAPILGGYIQEFLGWQANFAFMLLLGSIIYVFFFFKLPETHAPTEDHKLTLTNIWKGYSTVLANKPYMLAVTCLILIWSTFMIFSLMAPFIMQNRLGFSPSQYGLQALLVGLGFFVGNSINNFLISKLGSESLIFIGLMAMVVLSIFLLLLTRVQVNAWTIMGPIFLIMVAAGISFPHLYGRAVSAATQYAGIAGALIGSLILAGAVIITFCITQFDAHSAFVLAALYLVLSLLCLIINFFNKTHTL